MRKTMSLSFALALALSVLTSLSAPGPAGAANEILIGNIQDLSGPNKAFGLAMTNGAEMFKEKVNAAGGIDGRQLKIIISPPSCFRIFPVLRVQTR